MEDVARIPLGDSDNEVEVEVEVEVDEDRTGSGGRKAPLSLEDARAICHQQPVEAICGKERVAASKKRPFRNKDKRRDMAGSDDDLPIVDL